MFFWLVLIVVGLSGFLALFLIYLYFHCLAKIQADREGEEGLEDEPEEEESSTDEDEDYFDKQQQERYEAPSPPHFYQKEPIHHSVSV
ncbi:hypothetical protein QOT17_023071 [Balamuthia mandrillaris]